MRDKFSGALERIAEEETNQYQNEQQWSVVAPEVGSLAAVKFSYNAC